MKTKVLLFIFISLLSISLKAQSASEIFEKVKNAVVLIESYDYDGTKSSQGSGVILNSKGIMVTNLHNYAGNSKIKIFHNSVEIPGGDIIGLDIKKDILVMKIDDNTFPEIPIGSTTDLKIGSKVFTVGSPLGFENSISEGIISGVRQLEEKDLQTFIQFTADIAPGSSGGAVLNEKGELIGISTLGIKGMQGYNFGVIIEDIMNTNLGEFDTKEKLSALNFYFKGRKMNDDGKYSEAVSSFSEYLKMFPKDKKAFNFRGMAYSNKKDFTNAIKDFTEAIKIDPKFFQAYMNRAEVKYKMKDDDDAIDDFTMVIKLDPKNVDAYYTRGFLNSRNGHLRDAIDDFTYVIKNKPDYVSAWVNRGIMYYRTEKWEQCIIDLKKAIKLDPSLTYELNPLIDQADLFWQYNAH